MKKAIPILLLSAVGLSVLASFLFNIPTYALGVMDGVNAAHGTGTPTALFGSSGIITTITNTLLFIAGALAVIMIIVGGLRYVTSGGNSSNVTAAKNTVLYAIVGLIVAFLAFAAVNFVLGSVVSIGGSGVAPSNL
jgi:hypothetical protein